MGRKSKQKMIKLISHRQGRQIMIYMRYQQIEKSTVGTKIYQYFKNTIISFKNHLRLRRTQIGLITNSNQNITNHDKNARLRTKDKVCGIQHCSQTKSDETTHNLLGISKYFFFTSIQVTQQRIYGINMHFDIASSNC